MLLVLLVSSHVITAARQRRALGIPRRLPHLVLVRLLKRLKWRGAQWLAGYLQQHTVLGNMLAVVLMYTILKSLIKLRLTLVRDASPLGVARSLHP